MRKDNSIYNKKQPGLYIYLYLQSQIPTSCYSGKKTIRHFHGKISPYFRFSKKNIFSLQLYKGDMGHRTKRFFQWSGKMGERF